MGVTAGCYTGITFEERERKGAALRNRVARLSAKNSKKKIARLTGKSELTIRDILRLNRRAQPTADELEVLRLAQQLSNADIAKARGVGLSCVKSQLKSVFHFFGITGLRHKRQKAYELAYKQGLYEPRKIDYDTYPEPGKEYEFYLHRVEMLGWSKAWFDVLWGVSFGKTSAQMATERGVSPTAIRHLRQLVAAKLQVTGPLQYKILHEAVRRKLLPPIGPTEEWCFGTTLSTEEETVLSLVGQGYIQREIAARLGMKETIVHHLLGDLTLRFKQAKDISGTVDNLFLYISAVRGGALPAIEVQREAA